MSSRYKRQAVLPFVLLGPAVAWLLTLTISYVGQDFACSAADSAGSRPPGAAITTAVIVITAVFLVVALVAGAVGLRLYRESVQPRRHTSGVAGFVGLTGVTLAVLFSFGIVLIAVTPTVLGAC